MRKVTVDTAMTPETWTPERARKVGELFDGLAAEWHTRDTPGRWVPLEDAFERGGPMPTGTCLELGSGTGLITAFFAERFARVISADLALEMLRLAPPDLGARLQADASRLPLPDASIDCLALVNMLLFASEVDRVVAPDGVVLWVNTRGPRTPIHLTADEVAEALGPGWDGVAASAGEGTWSVFRRRN